MSSPAAKEMGAEGPHAVKSGGKLMYGDVFWIRIRGSLWWPAQVVDGKTVSRSQKPQKKLSNETLFRLYGTYTYLYRDPAMHRLEFEKILEQNNGSYRETFEKALEQDLSRKKSDTLKRTVCEPREEVGAETPKNKNPAETPKNKKSKLTNKMNDQKLNSPDSVIPSLKVSPGMSARKLRVMQNLGLVAPPGSPFRKNGVRSG